jgi:hypothetical protein
MVLAPGNPGRNWVSVRHGGSVAPHLALHFLP